MKDLKLNDISRQFDRDGYLKLGQFDESLCKELFSFVNNNIDFNNCFLEASEFKSQENHTSVNPIPGRNLAEKANTFEVFSNKNFVLCLEKLLGKKYRILEYKFVVDLSKRDIPDWIERDIANDPIKNIGAYIKPFYRSLTFFRGIDFHQDIIDFPGRNPDFITIYLHLSNVKIKDSPLFLLSGSHKLGPCQFPHNLHLSKSNQDIIFKNKNNNNLFRVSPILGGIGDCYCWHPYTLHGTYPSADINSRISLRIIAEKNSDIYKGCILDQTNNLIQNTNPFINTRNDLNYKGQSKGNRNLLEKIRDSFIN